MKTVPDRTVKMHSICGFFKAGSLLIFLYALRKVLFYERKYTSVQCCYSLLLMDWFFSIVRKKLLLCRLVSQCFLKSFLVIILLLEELFWKWVVPHVCSAAVGQTCHCAHLRFRASITLLLTLHRLLPFGPHLGIVLCSLAILKKGPWGILPSAWSSIPSRYPKQLWAAT